MSDNDQILQEFCGITGVATEEGKFFLESAAWSLEDALASYYESGAGGGSHQERGRDGSSESPELLEAPPPKKFEMASRGTSKKSSGSSDRPRITTLSSMKMEESDSEEEEGQRFYAGGSAHSGQEVLGPPGRANSELISELFRSVRELGGVETAAQSSSSGGGGGSSRRGHKFEGVGYRLGVTPEDSSAVTESAAAAAAAGGGGGAGRTRREITLRLWRDGFTINQEPLRSYTDPSDREFLRKIKSGQVPPELADQAADETLHLNMEDHRDETYPLSSRPARKPFGGAGYMLGSVAPAVVTSPAPAAPPADLPPPPAVDAAAPTTTVSIRFNDGSRARATLNTSHTVQDLRAFILNARPQLAASAFTLLASFPIKELTDNGQTLTQANLLDSSVMIRLQ